MSQAAIHERGASVTPLLALDNLLGNLGQYSLVPVLGVLIATRGHGAGASAVGVGLFVYFAAVGLSCLLVNRYLPRVRYTTALCASSVLAAAGFGALAFVEAFAGLLALLLVAGLGVSVHQMLARVLIAEHTSGDVARNRAYSTMNIALNVAGALGPFIASALYVAGGDARPLLAAVALCYLLGAAVLAAGLPRVTADRRPAPVGARWPVTRAGIRAVLGDPGALHTVLTATLATFVYAQFYSAFALLVARDVGTPLLRAVLLSGPAVAIVLLQPATTAVVAGALRRGVRPLVLLGGAAVLFGIALLVLGSGLPLVGACLVTVTLFSAAEMVYTPMTNTVFAALPVGSRLEALSFRQLCYTTGEALGSLCGGSVFLLLADRGLGRYYWLVLGASAVLAALLLSRHRTTGTPRVHRRTSLREGSR